VQVSDGSGAARERRQYRYATGGDEPCLTHVFVQRSTCR
jgi:hypothetical protein